MKSVQIQCKITGGCLDHGAAGLAETTAFLCGAGSSAFGNEKNKTAAWVLSSSDVLCCLHYCITR